MAARINKPNHEEKTKGLIRASQLLNRLIACGNGEVEMTAVQVNAARIAIGKFIPDLSAIEHHGEVINRFVAEVPAVAPQVEQWQQQHSPTQH
jgi:hypothetical protein